MVLVSPEMRFILDAYAFFIKFFKKYIRKLEENFLHVYLPIPCSHAQFRDELAFFVVCANKIKKSLQKSLF
jgi:hypothetical protein